MDRFWLILSAHPSMSRPGEEIFSSRGASPRYTSLEEAKQMAAISAGISNETRYVMELVGVQQPNYDPDIAWEPADG